MNDRPTLEALAAGDLALLRCPACGAEVMPTTGQALSCRTCLRIYPVIRGVPRMLPPSLQPNEQAVAEHFHGEFTAAGSDDDLGEIEHSGWILWTRTGLDPAVYTWRPNDWYPAELPPEAERGHSRVLLGKTVLDAGCGPARLARVAASGAHRLVALDVGDHIERARAVLSDFPNALVVQGSVREPPLAPGSFDVVYSVGVLHHTPDPAGAVRALARLLRPGGVLSIWVYPPEYWGGRLRKPFNRALHRWLRRQSPKRALHVTERVLYPLGRLQERTGARRLTKVLAAPMFLLSIPRHPVRAVMIATILDYFGPAIVSTHTPAEVGRWLRAAGLRDVRLLPVRSSATGMAP